MIKSFAHKGLEQFFTTGSVAGIQPVHAKRLRLILAQLDKARTIQDMDISQACTCMCLKANAKAFGR